MVALFEVYGAYLFVNKYTEVANTYKSILGFAVVGVFLLLNKFAWIMLYRAWSYKSGLDGEARVAKELEKLPNTYTVLQDVKLPNSYGNIDFVVLGPNGIWTIEAKNHSGNITYNGKELLRNGYAFEKNFIKQVHAEAFALKDLLQSTVDRSLYPQAHLVFSHRKVIMHFGEEPINEVVIIGVSWLVKNITNHQSQVTHTQEQIEEIINVLCNDRNMAKQPAQIELNS